MSKSYVSENGLPRAVATKAALPKNAFVGHLCYVEAVADQGLYQYNGASYDAVVTSSGSDEPVSGDLVISSADELPGTPDDGQLSFLTTDDRAYFYDGTNWKKIAVSSDIPTGFTAPVYSTVSALPEAASQTAGDVAYVTSTNAVYFSNGTNWSKLRTEVGLIAPTVADTDHYPSNPSTGQVVWLTGTGLQVYNGTAWKTITIES